VCLFRMASWYAYGMHIMTILYMVLLLWWSYTIWPIVRLSGSQPTTPHQQRHNRTLHSIAIKAEFTRYKFARASKGPVMREQTFHARYGKLDMLNFETSCDFHYSPCMKHLRAHLRHLTCANELASCKRGFMCITSA
jgi:hypothetical protein